MLFTDQKVDMGAGEILITSIDCEGQERFHYDLAKNSTKYQRSHN